MSMERLTNTRFESLDAMRGLASLAVVIFHIGSNEFQPYWLKFIATYGEVGVQLFFVLSGFIISFTSFKYLQPSTTMGSVQFMTKRFIRVYPPFFLSMILCIIVNYCLDNEIITFKDFLLTASLNYLYLGGIPPQGIYWTLIHEMQFYFFIAITLTPFFTKYRKWMVLFLGITSFFILARMISNPLVNGNLPRHFHSFYFGIFVFELYRIKTLKSRLTIFDLAYFLQFIVLIYISLIYINHRTIASIISTIIIGVLVLFNSRIKINNPLFLFLGKISFSLYLAHIPILKLTTHLLHIEQVQNFQQWLFCLIIIIILSYIFYYFFEKPFLTKSQSIIKPIQSSQKSC